MITAMLLACLLGPMQAFEPAFARDTRDTVPADEFAIPTEESPINGTKLTFKSGSNSYELDLPSGWTVERPFQNLASARVLKTNGDVGTYNYMNVYESTLVKERLKRRYAVEAKAVTTTRELESGVGKFVVLETFVPPALTVDGGSYGDHEITFALVLSSGRHLVLHFSFPFPQQLKEEAGVIKTVGILSLEEARKMASVNRRHAEDIVSTLRKGSKGSTALEGKPTPYSSSSLTLGGTKCLVSVPKGRSIKTVRVIVINIPPSGSAKVLAPSDCARRGWGSVALTGLDTSDPIKLRDRSGSVLKAIDKLRGDSKAKFVFCGFSAGGFAAAALTKQYEERCTGLITIGSFTAAQYLPTNKGLPIVFLLGSKDFNRSQALQVQRSAHADGRNVQLVTFEGGHSWGSTKEHIEALEMIAGGNR